MWARSILDVGTILIQMEAQIQHYEKENVGTNSRSDAVYAKLVEQMALLTSAIQSLVKVKFDVDINFYNLSASSSSSDNKVLLEAEASSLFDEMPQPVFPAVVEDQQALMLSETENDDEINAEEGKLLCCKPEVQCDSIMNIEEVNTKNGGSSFMVRDTHFLLLKAPYAYENVQRIHGSHVPVYFSPVDGVIFSFDPGGHGFSFIFAEAATALRELESQLLLVKIDVEGYTKGTSVLCISWAPNMVLLVVETFQHYSGDFVSEEIMICVDIAVIWIYTLIEPNELLMKHFLLLNGLGSRPYLFSLGINCDQTSCMCLLLQMSALLALWFILSHPWGQGCFVRVDTDDFMLNNFQVKLFLKAYFHDLRVLKLKELCGTGLRHPQILLVESAILLFDPGGSLNNKDAMDGVLQVGGIEVYEDLSDYLLDQVYSFPEYMDTCLASSHVDFWWNICFQIKHVRFLQSKNTCFGYLNVMAANNYGTLGVNSFMETVSWLRKFRMVFLGKEQLRNCTNQVLVGINMLRSLIITDVTFASCVQEIPLHHELHLLQNWTCCIVFVSTKYPLPVTWIYRHNAMSQFLLNWHIRWEFDTVSCHGSFGFFGYLTTVLELLSEASCSCVTNDTLRKVFWFSIFIFERVEIATRAADWSCFSLPMLNSAIYLHIYNSLREYASNVRAHSLIYNCCYFKCTSEEAGRSIKPLSYTMSCHVLSWPNMCEFDAAFCPKPFGASISLRTILEYLNGAGCSLVTSYTLHDATRTDLEQMSIESKQPTASKQELTAYLHIIIKEGLVQVDSGLIRKLMAVTDINSSGTLVFHSLLVYPEAIVDNG